MPKKMEENLKKEAAKKGFKPGSKRYGAYVWGTIDKFEQKAKKKK